MAQTFQFPSFSVTQDARDSLLEARYFGGTTAEDSLSLAVDPTTIDNLTNNNGNLSWTEGETTAIAVNSEIDFLSTAEHYYMNLNTDRSADVAFVMNERSRAIISNEWLDAYAQGDLEITYENQVGEEAVDTIITSDHGSLVFSDYHLEERLEDLETLKFLGGGIMIDFGIIG